MMKVQKVILRAMAGKLKWMDAADVLGISDRSLRHWRERYQQHGYDGLYDRRKGRPQSPTGAGEHGGTGAAAVSGTVL